MIVEGGVVAQLVRQVLDLGGGAGTADHPRGAPQPRELAGEPADGPRRARDEDGVALLEVRHVEQPGPGGQRRHAEHAEEIGRRHALARHGPNFLAVQQRVLAPAGVVRDERPDGQRLDLGGDHLADRTAFQGGVEPERRHVGRDVVHPSAHVRVDRQGHVAHDQLPLDRIGQLRLDEPGVAQLRLAVRTGGQVDLASRSRHPTDLRARGTCCAPYSGRHDEGDRRTARSTPPTAAGSRPEEALLLYTDAPLHALGEAADAVRRRRYPDNIATYIIDRNINYTNVCVTACKFCAFYRAPNHAEGWTHPTGGDPAPLRRGGRPRRHPDHAAGRPLARARHRVVRADLRRDQARLPAADAALARRVRGRAHRPDVRPRRTPRSSRGCKAAGLDSFAGAGAEILVERPRTAIAPLKESGRGLAGGHGDRARARASSPPRRS